MANEIIINDNRINDNRINDNRINDNRIQVDNRINNCNNTYNINLVLYDKENDKIEFDIKHMKDDMIYKLTTRNEIDAFKYYCDKLFENKNNQMIIKSNLKINIQKYM